MTDYDTIANDLHLKQIADQHTAEEIADSAVRTALTEITNALGAPPVPGYAAYDAALRAVRMARGEDEIL